MHEKRVHRPLRLTDFGFRTYRFRISDFGFWIEELLIRNLQSAIRNRRIRNLQKVLIAAGLIAAASIVTAGPRTAAFSHELFDRALKGHVRGGKVDYPALKKDPDFARYLAALADARPEAFKTEAERLAFWINAYNALTIKGVLDHYPIQSVMDVPGFFDKLSYPVGGGSYTLNQIENDLLRARFKEPRIHFALVCASTSCPDLQPGAFTPQALDRQLQESARVFLADPTRNRLDRAHKTLYLSKIFQWYAQDFIRASGSVLAFLKPYLPPEDQATLGDVKIEYLEYDWTLNKK